VPPFGGSLESVTQNKYGMYRFMENEVAVAEPDVRVGSNGNGSVPDTRTLISMQNIWKTYQM